MLHYENQQTNYVNIAKYLIFCYGRVARLRGPAAWEIRLGGISAVDIRGAAGTLQRKIRGMRGYKAPACL